MLLKRKIIFTGLLRIFLEHEYCILTYLLANHIFQLNQKTKVERYWAYPYLKKRNILLGKILLLQELLYKRQ